MAEFSFMFVSANCSTLQGSISPSNILLHLCPVLFISPHLRVQSVVDFLKPSHCPYPVTIWQSPRILNTIYYHWCHLTNVWCFVDLYDFSQIKISCYNSHLEMHERDNRKEKKKDFMSKETWNVLFLLLSNLLILSSSPKMVFTFPLVLANMWNLYVCTGLPCILTNELWSAQEIFVSVNFTQTSSTTKAAIQIDHHV